MSKDSKPIERWRHSCTD